MITLFGLVNPRGDTVDENVDREKVVPPLYHVTLNEGFA